MQRRVSGDDTSLEQKDVKENVEIAREREDGDESGCDDEKEKMVPVETFQAIVRERDQLRRMYRELLAKLDSSKSNVQATVLKGNDREGVAATEVPVPTPNSTDSGKDTAFRHLEEQLSFLVNEMTAMVRASKEKENQLADLQMMISKRDTRITEMKQEMLTLQEEVDHLNGKLSTVESDRNRLLDEREEVMSMMQNCVALSEEMDSIVTNVNELMRILWDNFAKLETVDVQLLANKKHCSHIEDIIQILNRDRQKVDIAFQTQLERKNKALEECLVDLTKEVKVMRELLRRSQGTKK
ncbi:ELKS/Rab6-interacting/CAST family member 1-like [Corticium candelabrum]|uniref:ELKS/Rab6-interacting/CAST family member 1-like n=1 Tax=Corticium candelabrum TaxID=121492 RepID=UPI002E265214|nr:ELKS/Rab6-interacting/CAST family member 1-like [Corticium candelabrum]